MRRLSCGILLIALATLALELMLMRVRVFDLMLTPNIASFVVTVAIFGFGLAGICATLRPICREAAKLMRPAGFGRIAGFGITVNAVGSVQIATDLIRSVPNERIDRLRSRQSILRLGTPADIANVIDFYLRRESDFITGQCLFLGGV